MKLHYFNVIISCRILQLIWRPWLCILFSWSFLRFMKVSMFFIFFLNVWGASAPLWIDYPMTFFVGNDTFYRKLYDLMLQRFEPTIRTRWNIISELILSHYFFFISLIGATFFFSFGSFLLLAIPNNFVFFLKRWNLQDKKLKDQLIKYLEHEFGINIFDHTKMLQKACKHLKVVRDSYRKSLVLNPKYERPPFFSVRD